jgi:inorganic pyrophosphatase
MKSDNTAHYCSIPIFLIEGDPSMPTTKQPQEAVKFEIQTYQQPKDRKALRSTHVAFSGSPQRHPYDREKIILVADPYSTHNFFYETMVRVWIKKMSIGMRCAPFIVGDTAGRPRDNR